jgi:hypothetical protein
MADPVTLSLGAMAVGTALKAKSQIDQAKAQARQVEYQAQDTYQQANLLEQSTDQLAAESQAAEYNAEVLRQQAVYARQQSAEQERRYNVQAQAQLGEIRARYGASGVTLEGSVMDVLQMSASNAALNALTIRHEGEVKAIALGNQEALERFRAANYGRQIQTVRANAAYVRQQAARTAAQAPDVRSAGRLAALGTAVSGAASIAGALPASSPGAVATAPAAGAGPVAASLTSSLATGAGIGGLGGLSSFAPGYLSGSSLLGDVAPSYSGSPRRR